MKTPILIGVFSGTVTFSQLTENEWDILLRQARKAMLLAKLYYLVESKQWLDKVPLRAFRYLKSAQVHAEKQANDLHWEIRHLEIVAKKLNHNLTLLKGAAYTVMGVKASKGRVFSDIDILVCYEDIASTEKQLMINGWAPSYLDDYDQRYYRLWMHEIPAMRHMFRGSVIDLHHNILPRTVKACPNANLLLENVQSHVNYKGINVLSSVDMIIHSATHLFYDGELEHGCRDILDLYDLLTEYLENSGMLDSLVNRANELGLQKPVYYALRYTHLILGFETAGGYTKKLNKNIPSYLMRFVMDFLFMRALMPDHKSCNDYATGVARWCLYVRSHWLRMPIYQLIPHLFRKSYGRLLSDSEH